MRTRLVVGFGELGVTLLDTLSERPGATVALVPDHRTEVLADRLPSVEVVAGDPTDPAAIASAPDRPESVIVASDDPERNLASARAVREVLPNALLVSYTGFQADGDVSRSLRDVSDRVVDPGAALGSFLVERLEADGESIHELRGVLGDIDGPIAVVMHDNPDPDAIASAVAFERIAEVMGHSAEACYYGSINHQENRAMVNVLGYDLRSLEPDADLSEFGGFVLVDHARPGINDGLPESTSVDVVIDHHPPRGPVNARFTDLRSDAGATSTLLVDYYRRLGVEMDVDVATGLLFGIRVDTDEFSREVSVADFEAGAFLLPDADLGLLERIENPSMSSDTLETIAEAILSRTRHGSVLLSGVGRIQDRDTLAQAADRLLNLDGITTTLVYGFMDGTVYVSARSRGTDLDLGEALRTAFGQIGSAGGHADMAGAQLQLGVLGSIEEGEESLRTLVDELITAQFLEVLDVHPSQVAIGAYGTGADRPVDLPDTDGLSAGDAGSQLEAETDRHWRDQRRGTDDRSDANGDG